MTEAHPTEDLVAEKAKRLGNEPTAAIPYEINGNGDWVMRHMFGGLTKREAFAAMAMQGWLAGCENAYNEFTGPATYAATAAKACVTFADALLKELAK